MSVPVTVDSDDLKALLFATAAIKGVEAALRQSKDDPFLDRVKPRLSAAHDRAANAWRDALRREQNPERFTPATDDEVRALVQMWPPVADDELRFCPIRLGVWKTPSVSLGSADPVRTFHDEAMEARAGIRRLVTRGLVELGVRFDVMAWGSSGAHTVRAAPEHWARLTERGLDAIHAVERAKRA